MRKIIFEIVSSGAPYPAECWWRIRGANGKIITASELMSKRNAARITLRVIHAIKTGKYSVKWLPCNKSRKVVNKKK